MVPLSRTPDGSPQAIFTRGRVATRRHGDGATGLKSTYRGHPCPLDFTAGSWLTPGAPCNGAASSSREDLPSPVAVVLIGALNAGHSGSTGGAPALPGSVGRGASIAALPVARADGTPVGCGRSARSTQVPPSLPHVRGAGMWPGIDARAAALEAEGQRLRCATRARDRERQRRRWRLHRGGFARIPPFGEYVDSPLSVCMGRL